MASLKSHECDSCGAQMDGWTKKELMDIEGWMFRTINVTRSFAMCDECVRRYEPAWEAKSAA